MHRERSLLFSFSFFLLGLLTRMLSEPPAWLYPAVFRHSEVPFSEPPHRSAHWGLLRVSEALLSSSWTIFWDGLSQVHRVSFKADLTERSRCWFVRLHLSRPLVSTSSDVRELLRKLPRSWYVWHLLIQNKELPLCVYKTCGLEFYWDVIGLTFWNVWRSTWYFWGGGSFVVFCVFCFVFCFCFPSSVAFG